jgi:hypothetical protein
LYAICVCVCYLHVFIFLSFLLFSIYFCGLEAIFENLNQLRARLKYYDTIIAPWSHGFKSWKQPLAEMQGKAAYIRPKVVGPFPELCASGSYIHRAALFTIIAPYVDLEQMSRLFWHKHTYTPTATGIMGTIRNH